MSDPTELLKVIDHSTTSTRTMKNSAGQIGFAPHNLILASEDFSDSNWTKTNTTVTSNAAAAPDGTITADKISHTSTTAQMSDTISAITGVSYRLGVFVKYIDHQWFRLYHNHAGLGRSTWFDLQNGVLGTDVDGIGSITPLSDGWYYLTLDVEAASNQVPCTILLADADNSGTETSGTEAYIWGAHLYENGLAGMFDVPENERALASLTKYLPNKAVVTGPNLVSNGTFDSSTAGWTADNAVISVSSGELVVDDTLNAGSDSRAYQDITTTVGAHYKFTFDQISTTTSFAYAVGTTAVPNGILYNGALGTNTGVFSAYFTATETTTRVSVITGGTGVTNYDNITVEEVDRNPSAARYLPRRENHEYINGAWTQGLLAESEARTNLITEAFDFSDAGWGKTRCNITANAATGPDGRTTADKLYDDSTASNTHYLIETVTKAASAIDYTGSFYLKAAEYTKAEIYIRDNSFVGARSGEIDLSAGTVGTASALAGGTPIQSTIEAVGNDWYRVSLAMTSTTDTAVRLELYLNDGTGSYYNGDGSSGIYVWGAQVEAASTPSSLIPTYGATRTRTSETFTQKSDKIIWPNTTYVDGTELVTNGGFDTDTDWTKGTGWTIGGGTASCDGTQVSTSDLSQTTTFNTGDVIEVTYTVSGRSAGSTRFVAGNDAGQWRNTNGTYTDVLVLTTTNDTFKFQGDSGFVGSIDNISVKEINPRALAVVMHGYMTYADEGGQVAVPWRYYVNGNNYILAELYASGATTGEMRFWQVSNGVNDNTLSDATVYSPGINVPFKIASRHLDDAVQGAADGTATTENTTPVGLPDLSATQAEWFYDFMGHITDVAAYVEDIEEGGLTALTAKGFPQ